MKKSTKPMYSFGGFLKKIGNGLGDIGMSAANIGLSTVGLTDVIDKSNYSGNWAKKLDGVADKAAPILGQVAATAIGGPAAGAALQAAQSVGKGINGDPIAEKQQADAQRQMLDENLRRQKLMSNQTLNNLPTMGVSGSGYYAQGGKIKELPYSKHTPVAESMGDKRHPYSAAGTVLPHSKAVNDKLRTQLIASQNQDVKNVGNLVANVGTMGGAGMLSNALNTGLGAWDMYDNYGKGNSKTPGLLNNLGMLAKTVGKSPLLATGMRLTSDLVDGIEQYKGTKKFAGGGRLPKRMETNNPQAEKYYSRIIPQLDSLIGAKHDEVYKDENGHECRGNSCLSFATTGFEAATNTKQPRTKSNLYNPEFARTAESQGWVTVPLDQATPGDRLQRWNAPRDKSFQHKLDDVGDKQMIKGKYPDHMMVFGGWDDKPSTHNPGLAKVYQDGHEFAAANTAQVQADPGKYIAYRYVGNGQPQAQLNPMLAGITPKRKLAMGGPTMQSNQPGYEVEEGEVVQGQNVQLEEGQQHASDLHEVGGESHAQGGTQGAGGERVFSDRLKPDGMKMTYAEMAVKLSKSKGKLEESMKRPNQFNTNTATRMGMRIDMQLDNLFQHQEMNKPQTTNPKFAGGGPLPRANWNGLESIMRGGLPRRPTGNKVQPWQQRLMDNGYDTGGLDGKWGPKSQAAYDAYTGGIAPMGMSGMDMQANIPGVLPNYTAPETPGTPGVDGNMFDFGSAARGLAGFDKAKALEDVKNFGAAAAPYVDNLVNAFIKPARPMSPSLVSAPQLNTSVDISPELANMSTQQRVANASLDNSTASSQSARANKIAAFSNTLSQTGQLYGSKRREEQNLMNQQAQLNASADNTNAQLKNRYNDQLVGAENERLGMISANAANASMDMQGQMRDRRLMENDTVKFKLVADRFRSSGVIMRKELEGILQSLGNDKKRAAQAMSMTESEFEDALSKAK